MGVSNPLPSLTDQKIEPPESTLFNTILGHDRAIMSSAPGTTRDTVEAWFELSGVPVCLIDTAGVWNSKKELDQS